MILMKDPIFCDPWEDSILPVVELDEFHKGMKLDSNHIYLIGDVLYKFIGSASIKDIKPGTIVYLGGRYMVEPYTDDLENYYNKKFIISKEEYENRVKDGSIGDLMDSYAKSYKESNNIIRSGNIKIVPIGDIYMPDIDKNDDPLERIIKLMLRHVKPVLNEYRGQFAKKHGLDNIKSALNGATKNMSILKFLAWCENFELDWEIVIDNLSAEAPSPLKVPIVMNNKVPYPWMDIPTGVSEDCFFVPLAEGEDPLKRGIKLALCQKCIDIRNYRKKSPTQHLINNMKSALKSKQKMTLPYFINWCEIIDLEYSFRVINRSDGIWYKITGYDVTTNDKEME